MVYTPTFDSSVYKLTPRNTNAFAEGYQNGLKMRQVEGQNSLGNAIISNTDQSGNIDTSGVAKSVAQDGNPLAATMLPDMQKRIIDSQQAQQQMLQGQLATERDYLSSAYSDPTRENVLKHIDDYAQETGVSPQLRTSLEASIPKDDSQIQGWIKDHMVSNLDRQKQLDATIGTPSTMNTGPDVYTGTTNSLTGIFSPSGQKITLGLSPETASDPTRTYDPNTRQDVIITRKQFVDQAKPIVSNGRYPGTQGVPVAPALGASEAANISAQGSANAANDLAQEGAKSPTMQANLQGMLSDLNQFNSGVGADNSKHINSMINRVSGYGITITPEQLASQEGFDKLAQQIANAQMKGLPISDQGMASSMGATPNSQLSKLGNQGIIHKLQGNEDYKSNMASAWQQAQLPAAQGGGGLGAESFYQFAKDYQSKTSPLVFQFARMTSPERKTMLSSMSAAQKSKLASQYESAVSNGMVAPPGNYNGGQ